MRGCLYWLPDAFVNYSQQRHWNPQLCFARALKCLSDVLKTWSLCNVVLCNARVIGNRILSCRAVWNHGHCSLVSFSVCLQQIVRCPDKSEPLVHPDKSNVQRKSFCVFFSLLRYSACSELQWIKGLNYLKRQAVVFYGQVLPASFFSFGK